jgi:hypothetical protein
MEGRSLLSQEPGLERPIFVVDRKSGLTGVGRRREPGDAKIAPPFYTLGFIGAFICDRLFMLNLSESTLAVSRVDGHTAPCLDEDVPTAEEVGQMIIDHLIESGYDTSSIEAPLDIRE